jgi:hypothetical protein
VQPNDRPLAGELRLPSAHNFPDTVPAQMVLKGYEKGLNALSTTSNKSVSVSSLQ